MLFRSMLTQIFVIVNKFNSDENLPKQYHVNFVADSADTSQYNLDTNLMINAKCFTRIRKLVGADRLWMQ